jgi:hypothetical protein
VEGEVREGCRAEGVDRGPADAERNTPLKQTLDLTEAESLGSLLRQSLVIFNEKIAIELSRMEGRKREGMMHGNNSQSRAYVCVCAVQHEMSL